MLPRHGSGHHGDWHISLSKPSEKEQHLLMALVGEQGERMLGTRMGGSFGELGGVGGPCKSVGESGHWSGCGTGKGGDPGILCQSQ